MESSGESPPTRNNKELPRMTMSFSAQDSSNNSKTTEKKKGVVSSVAAVPAAARVMMLLLLGAAVVAILLPFYERWSSSSTLLSSSRSTDSTTINNAAAGRRGEVRLLSSLWSSSRFFQSSSDTAENSQRQQTATATTTTSATPPQEAATANGSFEILDKVPHDAAAFTQGLQMVNDTHYYESLGLYGESAVRIVELKTANTVLQTDLGSQWFGEGLCQYTTTSAGSKRRLIQITWNEQDAFIYDADTLQELHRLSYAGLTSNGEGWGITLDTSQKNCLYVTDGSSNLHSWNVPSSEASPELTEIADRVSIYRTMVDNGSVKIPVRNLNELEYDPYAKTSRSDGGTLLANIWQYDMIVRINPATGHVTTLYDMTSLYPMSERPQSADVLNGIAAIPNHPNEYWITGKQWPYMFRVRLID
jgi:glutaminyl-peptide cyclotransferase